MPTKQQIGKAGELLVQYQLLTRGVESAPMTTDTGIDLVAFSPRTQTAVTIQVKTNLKPKPGGGKGKLALDWWIPDDSSAQLFALTDLSTARVWLFRFAEVQEVAQQHPRGRYHLYMTIDPTLKPNKQDRRAFDYDFERFRLEKRFHELF